MTRLSTLMRGSVGGAGESLRDGLGAQGRGCLSAWKGWEHWERKQSGPLLHSGPWQPCAHGGWKTLTDGLDGVSGQSPRGASASLAPGGVGCCLAGGGPFQVLAHLPQRRGREVLSEAEQVVRTVEVESLPI